MNNFSLLRWNFAKKSIFGKKKKLFFLCEQKSCAAYPQWLGVTVDYSKNSKQLFSGFWRHGRKKRRVDEAEERDIISFYRS